MAAVVAAALLCLMIPMQAGAAPEAGFAPARTSYTGIDPGKGEFYTYAPSIVQTNATTRVIVYCGNSSSMVVHDHIMLTVGHLAGGVWRYSTPRVVFGPEDDPNPTGFFTYHTCEPELIGGSFRFANTHYSWALFFTAESLPTNSTNQIGVAFANSPYGPFHADPQPIVSTIDDYGQNAYPNDCPTIPSTGQTLYCLGQPTATTIGGGRVVLAYTGNAGSPGNDSNPVVGIVMRELNLSNVPDGPCTTCFVRLPTGKMEEPLTQKGLSNYTQDAALAYDPSVARFVLSFDAGPEDSDPVGPPVTPVVTVATISARGLLTGTGTWQPQGNIGQCLSGHVYNHNSGLVRTDNGDIPSGDRLDLLYAIANNNLGATWGVWGYRIWEATATLSLIGEGPETYTAASANCGGLFVASANGHVTGAGKAKTFGSGAASNSTNPVVGFALSPDRGGYYTVARNGLVRAFGDARVQGTATSAKAVGMAIDTATGGYWVASPTGTVHGYNAPNLGRSTSAAPVVAIASNPNGQGYYLVSSNGQVTACGHAQFFGNMTVPPQQSVTAIAVTPDGLGYYLVTNGGTIAGFGDALLLGPSDVPTSSPITAMAVSTNGTGYWLASAAGTIASFGATDPTPAVVNGGVSSVVALAAS
jgi:hypothetical protein